MAQTPEFRQKIPPAILAYLKPDAPREARLMAAKGLVPMVPGVLATVLTYFLSDADEEVRQEARRNLAEMPPSVAVSVLKEPAHPRTLDFFGRERHPDDAILEAVLLNPLTPDETFAFLAGQVRERFTTIIAGNQVRLLRAPAIAEALKKNPQALKSTLETMASFLRINGVVLEGEPAELTPQEIAQILQEPQLAEEGEEGPGEEFPDILLEEEEEGEEPSDEKKKNIQQLLSLMTPGQKVKLALTGNKEVRAILIKDSNRVVSTSVVKNPAITEGEILGIAQLRTIPDDIIRLIANSPEWVKNYSLQVHLANNPKTPFAIALKFARQLHLNDLKKLVGNKNISGQLAKLARELFERKRA